MQAASTLAFGLGFIVGLTSLFIAASVIFYITDLREMDNTASRRIDRQRRKAREDWLKDLNERRATR